MRLLIYIEPTSYLLPLWREIKAHTNVEARVIFLEENFTQQWNLNLKDDPNIEILRGNFFSKVSRLLQLIRKNNLELVHLAGWGHPLLVIALLLSRMHGVDITIESDTHLKISVPAWRRGLKRLVLPLLFRIPKIFFPAGTRQAVYFRHYGVSDEKMRKAHMTVDVCTIMRQVDSYRAGSISSKDKTITFLYVGRLEIHKGIEDLVQAFTRITYNTQEKHKSELIIVGDGNLKQYVQSAANNNLNIKYMGRLTGEELTRIYSCADVFILPSRVEPWGLVINEAMAAGLAVIVTDKVGCTDDLVRDKENGYIVPINCPERLSEAMSCFVRQPESLLAMGQKSRQMISSWTIENEARIMMNAWDSLS